jgi:hypothetical protein
VRPGTGSYLEAGMSDDERAAAERLLALAEKASAGPWKCNVDVFDEGQDIQVCVQDDAIHSLFCADSGIQPTAEVSWADAKLTQTYRDGEFVAAACTLALQIARAYLAERPANDGEAVTRNHPERILARLLYRLPERHSARDGYDGSQPPRTDFEEAWHDAWKWWTSLGSPPAEEQATSVSVK